MNTKKACGNCRINAICRLRAKMHVLFDDSSFVLAFKDTTIKIGVYSDIQRIVAAECDYYAPFKE